MMFCIDLFVLYMFCWTCQCQGFEIFKGDLNASNLQYVPVDDNENCPIELEMDVYNPLYVVKLQVNCTSSEPCSIKFHIKDKLQASIYEICGNLQDVKAGFENCDDNVVFSRVRRLGLPPYPLQTVRCGLPSEGIQNCSPKAAKLDYEGLTPCSNFGQASVSMEYQFHSRKLYFADSTTDCSGLKISERLGTIASQHTLTPSSDIPQQCHLTLVPPAYPHDLCIKFLFVKFWSLKLMIENYGSSVVYQKWDYNTVPRKEENYCFRGNGGFYNITVLREGREDEGFVFNYLIRLLPTTEIPDTTVPQEKAVDEPGSGLATTIAISVSVLVTVALTYVCFRFFNSKYRPCCREEEDFEVGPEEESLQNFTELPAAGPENEERISPTAPPIETVTVNHPSSWAPDDGSGDSFAASNSNQTNKAPPPRYDSLFPDTSS